LPVISNLVFTKTDSTIVGTWDTDTSSDSNMTAGGKAAIDNGKAPNTTTGHQCVVAGLLPNTLYSCVVTSGGTSSAPQNITTNVAQTRILTTSGTMGSVSETPNSPLGDTFRSCVMSDGFTYMTQDDGNGFQIGSTLSSNTKLGKITNESALTGTNISLSNYGAFNTTNGTDGPSGAAMTNKSTGLFGINGHIHTFVYRQFPPTYSTNRYCNWIKSTNGGATWNNFTALSTFTANGNPVTPNDPTEPIQFYVNTIGIVTPVLYAADDGTLGYNTAGNQIDGGNAYVYCSFGKDTSMLFMLRIPRIDFDNQTTTAFEYWVGPQNPAVADFVNDSNWSSSPTSATNILANPQVGAWFQIAFVPGINTYIMTTWTSGGGSNFTFYSAVTPAGPWRQFFFQNNPTSGMHWYGPFPFHRDLLGNALTNNIPVRIVFNGEPNLGHYRPNWSTLTLRTDPLMTTFVQGVGDTALGPNTQSMTRAYSSDVAAGDLLAVAWRRGTSGSVDTVSDNLGAGNVWAIVYDTNATGAIVGWAWTVSKGSGPCTVTVHQTVSQANGLLAVGEWNGPNTLRTAPAANLQSGTNSLTSASVTQPLANDLVLGIFGVVTSTTAFTASGGGVAGRVTAQSSGTTKFIFIEDYLSSIPTAATCTDAGAQTGAGSGIGVFFVTTFAISGSLGAAGAGASVAYSGPTSGGVVADGSGNYTIPNLGPGTYVITPSLTGYTFSPTSQNAIIAAANTTGVNFTASLAGGGTFDVMLRGRLYITRVVSGL
jgi:hypothetical protein